MFRRLLTILAGISLVVWVLALALWARRSFRFDAVEYYSPGAQIWALTDDGLTIWWIKPVFPSWPILATGFAWRSAYLDDNLNISIYTGFPIDRRFTFLPGIGVRSGWGGLDVQMADRSTFVHATGHELRIEWWAVLMYPAMLPLLWLLMDKRYRRRQRAALIQKQICVNCGYDLRASTDRCPECGTPIPPQPVSTIRAQIQ